MQRQRFSYEARPTLRNDIKRISILYRKHGCTKTCEGKKKIYYLLKALVE